MQLDDWPFYIKVTLGYFPFLGPFDRKINKFPTPGLSWPDAHYKDDSCDQVCRITPRRYGGGGGGCDGSRGGGGDGCDDGGHDGIYCLKYYLFNRTDTFSKLLKNILIHSGWCVLNVYYCKTFEFPFFYS